jgi:hypothetical protein
MRTKSNISIYSLFMVIGLILTYSCKKDDTSTKQIPTLTTTTVTNMTDTSATSGGNITSDGGSSVTVRGVCWATFTAPTTDLTTKTTDGTGTGIFTSNITGLTANTIYHVRAYATNAVGTAYGNEWNFCYTVVSFEDEILPIFSSNCTSCHSGSLNPDLRPAYAYNSLVNGGYLNLSVPASSTLYSKLNTSPHNTHVTVEEKENILTWISQGALNN